MWIFLSIVVLQQAAQVSMIKTVRTARSSMGHPYVKSSSHVHCLCLHWFQYRFLLFQYFSINPRCPKPEGIFCMFDECLFRENGVNGVNKSMTFRPVALFCSALPSQPSCALAKTMVSLGTFLRSRGDVICPVALQKASSLSQIQNVCFSLQCVAQLEHSGPDQLRGCLWTLGDILEGFVWSNANHIIQHLFTLRQYQHYKQQKAIQQLPQTICIRVHSLTNKLLFIRQLLRPLLDQENTQEFVQELQFQELNKDEDENGEGWPGSLCVEGQLKRST